jgi:cobalt-zinc-cadmium efflux system membrane fusion protein
VIRAFKVELGSEVAKDAPLAIIESASVAESRARLKAARARAEVAEATYRREKELYDRGISALREVEAADQARQEANGEVSAALAALEMVGASAGESGAYELRAPSEESSRNATHRRHARRRRGHHLRDHRYLLVVGRHRRP